METLAVVLEAPERLALSRLGLEPPEQADALIETEWSGISTGTEKLLWSGAMPSFPGMGYPLVPGYETVGKIVEATGEAKARVGQRVFVPGAKCFGPVRGLFGGAASHLAVAADKTLTVPAGLEEEAVLLALAATAEHAVARCGAELPDLVIGHGVLGRLIARLVIAHGGPPPMVWESDPLRLADDGRYPVGHADADPRADYRCICDVSGDPTHLDAAIARLARGGQIVLAGFYAAPLSFTFPPAFMREATIRIAAEWTRPDLEAVTRLLDLGQFDLAGLITHRMPATAAVDAYRTAFTDRTVLKMVLDWRGCQ